MSEQPFQAAPPRSTPAMPATLCPIEIDDFEDSRLADYQNLKDAELARARNRFIVEGRGNLLMLLRRSPHRPVSILLSERRFRAMHSLLEEVQLGCPVYVAPQPILDRVVGFPIHRGCLASCGRPKLEEPIGLVGRLLKEEPAPRILILEGVSDHDNVGSIFRNAMALGARAVLACSKTCDPLYRKAIRTSMGGSLCVPFARMESWTRDLEAIRALGFSVLALHPKPDSALLDDVIVRCDRPVALMVGAERDGIRAETLAFVDRCVRIEMEEGVDSLNVAVASGIALSALRTRAALQPSGEAQL